MIVDPIVQKAFQVALESQKKSYAPYSNFHVGAALKLKNSDDIIGGCNVENASYGATICAERVAIGSAVSGHGKPDFEFLVVITNTDPAIGPCALCLQMIGEFASGDLPIYLANKNGIQNKVLFKECLPKPFSVIPKQI